MLEKGGFSFVALLVINPLVILLFQDFSLLPPTTQGQLASRDFVTQKRNISSVVSKVELNRSLTHAALGNQKSTNSKCDPARQACPSLNIE